VASKRDGGSHGEVRTIRGDAVIVLAADRNTEIVGIFDRHLVIERDGLEYRHE
jgi:hypothetical protein